MRVYHNGNVLKEIPLAEGQTSVSFRESLEVKQSGWFTLTATGPRRSHPMETSYPMASTNAIRVYVGDRKIRNLRSAEYFLDWIDRLKEQATRWPDWRSPKEKDHVLGQFDRAKKVYKRLAREARSP